MMFSAQFKPLSAYLDSFAGDTVAFLGHQ